MRRYVYLCRHTHYTSVVPPPGFDCLQYVYCMQKLQAIRTAGEIALEVNVYNCVMCYFLHTLTLIVWRFVVYTILFVSIDYIQILCILMMSHMEFVINSCIKNYFQLQVHP